MHSSGPGFNECHILSGYLTDYRWKRFTTYFLAGIVKFLKTEFLPRIYGEKEFLKNQLNSLCHYNSDYLF